MGALDITLSEITAEVFHGLIQEPNDILLLDVRNDQEFAAWRIEGLHTPETLHVPYVAFVEDEEGTAKQVPDGRPVVVVCAKGGASDYVADILRQAGHQAVNLAGGMIAWGNLSVVRTVEENKSYAIYQFDRPARGCLSYILASQGEAAVIDPLRHTDRYIELLERMEVQPVLVLDTHAHADHISGGPALSGMTGAPYYLHPYDGIHPFDFLPAKIPYEMLSNGMEFYVGDLKLRTLHVPGHTLGLVNFLVSAPDGQTFLLTGDSLFIKSFGRPDLGGQGQAWAPLVYESLFDHLRSQTPGDAWVLPGHYAQPEEGDSARDGLFTRRMDDLWSENKDLHHPGQEAFVDHVLNHLPVLPEQYIQIKRVNAGLVQPDEHEASELELGKNICALSTAY